MPTEKTRSLRWRLLLFIVALAALIGLAISWRWTPLHDWLDVDRIVAALRQLGQTSGPAAAICAFALMSTAAIPLTFLTLVTIVAFGPMAGFSYSVTGALLGAAASYGAGLLLGREVVRRLAGERVNALSRRLAGHGILAVVTVRLVPVAPFAIINMIAGASHIRLRDLLIGTAIGIMPSTLAMMFFVDQIISALKEPTPVTLLILALTLLLIGLGVWGLRRWVRSTEDK